jgi:hypothetical protein
MTTAQYAKSIPGSCCCSLKAEVKQIAESIYTIYFRPNEADGQEAIPERAEFAPDSL